MKKSLLLFSLILIVAAQLLCGVQHRCPGRSGR